MLELHLLYGNVRYNQYGHHQKLIEKGTKSSPSTPQCEQKGRYICFYGPTVCKTNFTLIFMDASPTKALA